MWRLLDKGRPPIGLDLGTRTVRAIQLERRGGGWAAAAAAKRVLPAGLPATGDERRRAEADAVRDMLAAARFSTRKVVSCLPVDLVQYKNLRLPPMPPDELRAAVEWEAADRLSIGQNYRLQFYDAGEVRQGDQTRQEIILLAAPTEAVTAHTQMLTSCGLDPVAIDAAPSAMARYAAAVGDAGSDVHLVIDVGHSASQVLVSRGTRVLFFKTINVGMRQVDEAIARHLGIDLADATEIRRQRQTRDRAEEGHDAIGSHRRDSADQAVAEGVRGPLTDLAREVGLCVRYYSVTFRGQRPESTLVVGGGAGDALVTEALVRDAGVSQSLSDSAGAVDFSRLEPSLLTDGASSWIVAAGLSMRSEDRLGAERGAA